MNAESAYRELVERSRQRAMLVSCIELLSWDELTYMPRGGVENRGRKLAYLGGLYHDAATEPRLGELLAIAAQTPQAADVDSPVSVNLAQWRRSFERQSRLPRRLVEEEAILLASAQQVWAKARRDDDYSQFQPWLAKILDLKRSEAACLGHQGEPYDALLDGYEPGLTTAELRPLLEDLRRNLWELLARVLDRQRSQPCRPEIIRREYPIERQRILAESVAADLGFDFDRGRLDNTTHPFFSAIGPGDVRITTRFNQYDIGEAIFSTLHELGHGLYEQGLDPAQYGTPSGESSSMSIHESQSRFWEVAVGKSYAFWRHFFPRVRDLFHHTLDDVSLQDFYQAVNYVEPGPNRVRADAITYDLHIVIRFELEQALLTGDLPESDLPAAWNERCRNELGVTITSDAEGCLQDGHWAAGQFGYFPTYTLGNVLRGPDCPRHGTRHSRVQRSDRCRAIRTAAKVAMAEHLPARPAISGRRTDPPRDGKRSFARTANRDPGQAARALIDAVTFLR